MWRLGSVVPTVANQMAKQYEKEMRRTTRRKRLELAAWQESRKRAPKRSRLASPVARLAREQTPLMIPSAVFFLTPQSGDPSFFPVTPLSLMLPNIFSLGCWIVLRVLLGSRSFGFSFVASGELGFGRHCLEWL